jgi:hydrogenase maturation protease
MNREIMMQTSGSVDPQTDESAVTAPVLLLGLGNPLMLDDGAGQALLAQLESMTQDWGSQVEFLDGGTQGLALLGRFDGRKAVVFLDAVRLGDKPGAVHVLEGGEVARMRARGVTAHEGSVPQILAALQLLEETPKEVAIVGLEPERVATGIGLSPSVRAGLPAAASVVRSTITRILSAI